MSFPVSVTKKCAASAGELWKVCRSLDFSFLSNRVVASLKEPASIGEISDKKEQDKARTALSYEPAWTKVGTIRSIEMDSIALAPPVEPNFENPLSKETLEQCFVFPMDVKLVSYDDENRSLRYEIVNPQSIHIPSSIAASLSTCPAASTFAMTALVKIPQTFSLTISSDSVLTWSAESMSDTDGSSPSHPMGTYNELDMVFAQKMMQHYGEQVENALKASPYPLSSRRSVTDNYFGTAVRDPFRWLEDPDSPETSAWVDAQNLVTEKVLKECPTRAKILERLPVMYNYERFSAPFKRGKYYYYSHNDGLQNQSVYFQTTSLDVPGRVFLDPASLDPDSLAALSIMSFSRCGTYVALGVQRKGSDWSEVFVRHTDSLEDTATDKLQWLKFTSISWNLQGTGFFYARYPAPSTLTENSSKSAGTETDSAFFQTLYYHELGTSQDQDVEVYSTPDDPSNFVSGSVTEDGRYLVLTLNNSCDDVNKLYVASLQDAGAGEDYANLQFARIVDNLDASYSYVTSFCDTLSTQETMAKLEDGEDLSTAILPQTSGSSAACVFITNLDAPKSRLITIDLQQELTRAANGEGSGLHTNKDKKESLRQALDLDLTVLTDAKEKLRRALSRAPKFTELLPEHPEGGVLSSALCAAGYLIVQHNVNVVDVLSSYTLHSTSTEVHAKPHAADFSVIPANSTLGVSGRALLNELFVSVTSIIHPGDSYVIDLSPKLDGTEAASKRGYRFKASSPKGFDSAEYEVHQKFFTSKDGTQIPMFISHRKGLTLDASNPVYLYGYGGFNISLTPSFSINRWLWMKHFDGVAVIVNLRGGGEFGEDWHAQGVNLQKQNVFDDFQYAAKFLVSEKYTSHDKICIHGGSNGGLLVAACANQEPQLFGAAVAAVGVLDMLRFHKFTVGFAWCSDYGCSEANEAEFKNLHKISPYHSVPIAPVGSVGSVGSATNPFPTRGLPPIMVTTSDHDDRVAPLHSLKYIAMAQNRLGHLADHQALDVAPIIARIETKAGHGAGKPLNKVIAEHADVFSFFAKYVNAVWRD